MFKKKICLVIIFVLMSIGSVCLANNDSRWLLVFRDESKTVDVSFDTTTIKTYGPKEAPYIDCWINTHTYDDHVDVKTHTYINAKNHQYRETQVDVSMEGKYMLSKDNSIQGWKNPKVGSIQEQSLLQIIKYEKF